MQTVILALPFEYAISPNIMEPKWLLGDSPFDCTELISKILAPGFVSYDCKMCGLIWPED